MLHQRNGVCWRSEDEGQRCPELVEGLAVSSRHWSLVIGTASILIRNREFVLFGLTTLTSASLRHCVKKISALHHDNIKTFLICY